MDLELMLFSISCLLLLTAWLLFILFGQLTARKLRKNQATKEALGLELMSGWEIFNIAEALVLPRRWSKRLSQRRMSSAFANAELIRQHTNRFDRFLGRSFVVLLVTSIAVLLTLMILSRAGVFGAE